MQVDLYNGGKMGGCLVGVGVEVSLISCKIVCEFILVTWLWKGSHNTPAQRPFVQDYLGEPVPER